MKIYHKPFTSHGEGYKRGDYQIGITWEEPNLRKACKVVYKVLKLLPIPSFLNIPPYGIDKIVNEVYFIDKDNMIVRELYFWEWPLFYLWKRKMQPENYRLLSFSTEELRRKGEYDVKALYDILNKHPAFEIGHPVEIKEALNS